MAKSIQTLSDHFQFSTKSVRSVESNLVYLSGFLNWCDKKEHVRKFEPVLSDPDLTLKALEDFHRYLRHRVQTRTIERNTAATQSHGTASILSVIHGRRYTEEIRVIRSGHRTQKVLKTEEAVEMASKLTAVFDSACRIIDSCTDIESDGTWKISISTENDRNYITLREGYSRARLLELAAISYAALVIFDSGTNLAQLQMYEEPTDLATQLADPERVSLTQKVIKMRAGGKYVPVTMTALTFTRLNSFRNIRAQTIELLDSVDIAPFFFMCSYKYLSGGTSFIHSRNGSMKPSSISPISDGILSRMRKKFEAIGVELPNVTFRQLRAYRQQHLIRKNGLKVAAEAMGHSIATAVKSYCAAQEKLQAKDLGNFLSSLQDTVIHHVREDNFKIVSIPVGECASHGNPKASSSNMELQPDCKKTEGCFFCENFRIHVDEEDLRKLLSCKNVLQRLGNLQHESERADRVYDSILARIEVLVGEIVQRMDETTTRRVEADVAAGNLTHYWSIKVQQLGLLGFLNSAVQQ